MASVHLAWRQSAREVDAPNLESPAGLFGFGEVGVCVGQRSKLFEYLSSEREARSHHFAHSNVRFIASTHASTHARVKWIAAAEQEKRTDDAQTQRATELRSLRSVSSFLVKNFEFFSQRVFSQERGMCHTCTRGRRAMCAHQNSLEFEREMQSGG